MSRELLTLLLNELCDTGRVHLFLYASDSLSANMEITPAFAELLSELKTKYAQRPVVASEESLINGS